MSSQTNAPGGGLIPPSQAQGGAEPSKDEKKGPTQEEKNEECFGLFDKNGDGTILVADLPIMIRALGANPSDDELKNISAGFPTGKVNKEQFVMIMKGQKIEDANEEEIKEAFQIFDHDKDGQISAPEMRYVLKNFGVKLTAEEVESMIEAADVDGDGLISYDEFKKLLLK